MAVIKRLSPILREFVTYGGVGVLNTLLGVVLMAGGAWLGWHYAVYTAVSYALAMVFSFAMNAWLTFRTRDALGARFGRFMAVNLVNMGLVQGVQWGLIDGLGWAEWLGVATGMVAYTLLGFVANKMLVFGRR